MKKFAATELILNPDNSIYHLKLKPENIADTILLVGDPQRVEMISSYFDVIEFKMTNREFITHTGIFKGKRITTLSTGIGTDNIDIVVNELDALVNIDLENKTENTVKKKLNLIRLGTSGALQANIPVDSLVLSTYGLGFDGLIHYYQKSHLVNLPDMVNEFVSQCNWPAFLSQPYCVKSSEYLTNILGEGMIYGITATATGFYGPQGRELRLGLNFPLLNKKIEDFQYQGQKITNFEMETSALYCLSKMLGHNAVTICSIIANRVTKEYSKDYKKTVEKMVVHVLNKLSS